MPSVRDVFRMYAGMTHGTTVRDLCLRFDPSALHIDERRLVQFGVLEGLIRRIQRVNKSLVYLIYRGVVVEKIKKIRLYFTPRKKFISKS